MDMMLSTPLLGGLSPQAFMRRHWQKKPLLIRQAVPRAGESVDRASLFSLAAQDTVESRLIRRQGRQWSLRHGPFSRRQLPSLKQAGWTLLVQGVDLHLDSAHGLLSKFRFVPEARLDDLMVSYASDGGGVGPHFDSYDVFLLQAHGSRRWRIGRVADPKLQAGVPLKILTNFEPETEWLLHPGDMLYLPPRWAHDGVAEGECVTCSIGFRSATHGEIAREVLQRLIDAQEEPHLREALYKDSRQPATSTPGAMPEALQAFASDAVRRLVSDERVLARALGEWLSEPKQNVWFDGGASLALGAGVRLDRRTRMLYDQHHVFINGESYLAAGVDKTLMRRLADQRSLAPAQLDRFSDGAAQLLHEWARSGWLHKDGPGAMSAGGRRLPDEQT